MLALKFNTLFPQPPLSHPDSEDRYLTNSATWEYYETLLNIIGDNGGYRVTYLDGVLEIMSTSRRHETDKTRIGNLLELYFLEADIEYFTFGSTTLKQEEQRAGLEADEGYCFGTDKDVPDLAIEVVVTSGGIPKLEVYRRLQVPEVWFWQNGEFSVYHFRSNLPAELEYNYGYERIENSELLPDINLIFLAECVNNPQPLAAAKMWRNYWR
ncbi:Uma2 family endonuclease [Roseofilum sp. Guam]|uniref:Uma2 family endonuclease n=1 Tax=Roseofilum sp. Guam TaxID=2821502 RepID=UPI001B10F7BE|nr:Uma2 family endonuclease [Roseofilum sp. Guam]MBP0030593.1 Uma2 family endonuclease [Roseofilum sp. Guam]